MGKCPPGFVLRSVDGSGGLTCQCDYGDGNILACSLKDQSVDLKVTYMVTFIFCHISSHRMVYLLWTAQIHFSLI